MKIMLLCLFTPLIHAVEGEANSHVDLLKAKKQLVHCDSKYDALSTSSEEYFSNGACVIESVKTLMTSPTAKLEFDKEYSCLGWDDHYPVMDKELLQGFSSLNQLIRLMKPVEWIYSSHYYDYLPCTIAGKVMAEGIIINFMINLAGPGVIYINNKQYSFSDPKYHDCFIESDC